MPCRHANLLLVLIAGLIVPMTQAYTLITFDVDGTLVHGSGKAADTSAHNRAYSYACGKILGNGTPTIPVAEALPRRKIHGSTDGLILLRLARAALGVEPTESFRKLPDMMQEMYSYISDLNDDQVVEGIETLPGVLGHLETLAAMKDRVACGLVTGNVEGIARRKMRGVGVLDTGALAPPSTEQSRRSWPGADDIGFLGGFGSDYCSGDIDDSRRNHLDRAEQIAIATARCQMHLMKHEKETELKRVVHVGDAPADVLAAKAFAMERGSALNDGICVGMVAVATGSYSSDELKELAGEPKPGQWEPVILERGMADPSFIQACGVL